MHELSGRWTSKVFRIVPGQIPIPVDDGWFDLQIEDDGTVLTTSTHTRGGTSNPVEGRAFPNGLILEEVIDVAGNKRAFFGIVLIKGIIEKVLVGAAKKPTTGRAAAGQEEGTWVGTQP